MTEKEIIRRIKRRELDTGPLRIEGIQLALQVGARSIADIKFDLVWDRRSFRFLAECVAESTPKRLRAAMAQVKENVQSDKDSRGWPMIVTPYLSESDIDMLLDQGVSGVDLSGNYAVTVPGELFVVRTGRSNQFPASRSIKKIYQGTSSLVSRVLLGTPKFETVTAVRNEIERRGGSISLGTVSKVLKSLDEELMVRRDPTIQLLQPDRLLERLAGSYKPPQPTQTLIGKSQLKPSFFDRILWNAGNTGSRIIGRSESMYAISGESDPRLTIYVTSLEGLTDVVAFEETHRFANVEFLQIRDDLPFFDPNEEEGFRWCSQLQIYLELMAGGKRERETASQIRNDLLDRIQSRLGATRQDGS
jgi:hypothetical protein